MKAVSAITFLFLITASVTQKQSVFTMASSKQTVEVMEEFICAICLELLNVPVILECGHNFCKSCIDRVWDSEKQPSCPECREEYTARKYAVNRLLANAIKNVQIQCQRGQEPDPQEKKGDGLCREHEESLKLFCEDDESLVCLMCVPEHRGHNFLTVQKAVNKYKDNLIASLSQLQSKLKGYNEKKCQQEMKMSEVTANARSLQLHISSDFAKLHEFLQHKEEKLIQQLKEEETGILKEMKENLRKIKEDINGIQKSISNVQLQLQQQDELTFLKEIKAFLESLLKDQEEGESQSVVAHNLSLGVYKGPLQYGVWKEMESILNPKVFSLSLDPETAHPNLILSVDLTSTRCGDIRQQLPDHPKRFDSGVFVLGPNGFTSGRHYWEVVIRNKTEWYVGIMRASINKKGFITLFSKNGYWAVSLRAENNSMPFESPPSLLNLSVKLQRIGMYLDYEAGQVSFYNADNMSHLYTFSDTFAERLFPFFSLDLAAGSKLFLLNL
ncbi:zinc-binding protein A33-like [Protopterus annectens]|uniref:zinc-binding protein A33-like n=1 Tax=Protopterus annectens TaxID=7888 RepID=UPI001CFC0CE9|nr:zinc-binding protein A33-like [Protopterus annectens]